MNPIVSILWMIIQGIGLVNANTGRMIIELAGKIERIVNNIYKTAEELIIGNNSIKISSGVDFEQDWIVFKTKIREKLRVLNLERSLSNLTRNGNENVIINRVKEQETKLLQKLYNRLKRKLEQLLTRVAENESVKIIENLGKENFFNMSEKQVNKEVTEYLKLGRKFTPFCKIEVREELRKFEEEITQVINNLFRMEAKKINTKNIFVRIRLLLKSKTVKHSNDTKQLLNSILRSYKTERISFKKLLQQKNKMSSLKTEKQIENIFKPGKSQIIVASDKNIGYVCLDKDDLLSQYLKINQKQHFGKTNITETWYIKNVLKFLKEASLNIPLELGNIVKKIDFNWIEKTAEIGTLRLMPKLQKLKEINKSTVENLTCRGIKSSMKDPIKRIQITLDKIYSHLLYFVETEFSRLYGILSPSVTGIDEAIERIKKSKTGCWGSTIELEGDFGDLYSNCNKNLLENCIIKACKIAGLNSESESYIINLMRCSMNHSYFKEPTGIFKTLEGFSMGDNSAARGSELILRIHELDIFKKIYGKKLQKSVSRYLRFRDDVSVHVHGDEKLMFKIIKIIVTGYPAAIQFNVETRIIYGKFLNIKIINIPEEKYPFTTVLRKENSKYDVIPFNSNVSDKYKKMAGLCYFRTNRTHTSSKKELENQNMIVEKLLRKKGFPNRFIQNIKSKNKGKDQGKEKKKFTGITVYNNISQRHIFVKNVVKNSILDKETHYLPAEVPGKKIEQFVFTINKMKKQLNFK